MDSLGVAAGEVVEVVVHARHDHRDVAGAGEVAEHLRRAAVARRVEEQEMAVGVVELVQLAQARVVGGDTGRLQALDLAVDRLGIGAVAEADRRAVEVADELRVLLRQRLGDGGVEALEELGDGGRVGIRGDHAFEVARGALERRAVDRGRGRRAAAAVAGDLADRADGLVRDPLRRPGSDQCADNHGHQQQHADVLGRHLSADGKAAGSAGPAARFVAGFVASPQHELETAAPRGAPPESRDPTCPWAGPGQLCAH